MRKLIRRAHDARVLDGKYELLELVEFMGDSDHTSLWRGVVHGAAAFTRDVAIRRLPSAMKARQEALRGAAIEHANVVRVYDVCRDESQNLYLVMEWIDGTSIGDLTRGAHRLGLRVPWPLVGCIGVGALHGLAAGHARIDVWNVEDPAIHGHLSERSLLVDRRGVVHVTPFGLSQHAPLLMPTPADDLRELASVLWEALASAPTLSGDVDAPPSPVRDVLARALDHEFASADQMARELAAALASVPWRRGPQPDTGDAVGEGLAALASPAEDPVPESPFDLSDLSDVGDVAERTDEYEPYASVELVTREASSPMGAAGPDR